MKRPKKTYSQIVQGESRVVIVWTDYPNTRLSSDLADYLQRALERSLDSCSYEKTKQ